MKKLLFVYNPHSGVQTITRRLGATAELFTEAGYDVTVHPTLFAGDCRDTVQRLAEGFDRVVCAGGDGIHNEAVNGLMSAGADMPYGYIPCGSTNDFSHSVGIPTRLLDAAKTCVEGVPFRYDLGFTEGRYFTYVAGFGAFTEVTYTTPQQQKNALGYFAYLISGAASLPNIVPYHVSFSAEERSGEGDYVLGLVTNTLQVAGMKNILPQNVALDDGLLEVLLVKNPKNPIELNKILAAVMKHDFSADCFEYFKTKRVRFRSSSPLAWTLDGENGGSRTETEITCVPSALSILTRAKK